MATQDMATTYYSAAPPQHGVLPAAPAKVVSLSRAQINLGQGGQSPGVQGAPQQVHYVQPAYTTQPTSYGQPGQPGQPQVFTVGSSQLPQHQQQQQFRVMTTIGQTMMSQQPPIGAYGGGQMNYSNQPMTAVAYQQQQPYQQQHVQPGQVYMVQSSVGQSSPQRVQPGNVVAAYPASANQQAGGMQPMNVQPAAYTLNQQPTQAYQQEKPHPAYTAVPAYSVGSQQTPTSPQPYQAQQTYPHQGQYSQPPPQVVYKAPQPQPQPQTQQTHYQVQVQPQAYRQAQPAAQPAAQTYQHQEPEHFTTVQGRPPQQRPAATSGVVVRAPKVRSLPMRNSAHLDGDGATGPPQFVHHPVPHITVGEGEPASLTAKVQPAGDSSLHVEWFKNGKPLPAASRFTTTFDRGYAVLDFLYTNVEDNGEYSCVASNNQGQDQSTGCRITIVPEESVVTDTQLPEESMIANLAAMEESMQQNGMIRGSRYRDEPGITRPPTFLKPLNPQTGLRENQPAHFETIVEPANDNSLTIEWFKDGKPVSTGCRFSTVMDRGFAILDILYTYPEDNGAYYCVAKNALGQVQSNVVDLQCTGDERIVTSSALSKESISYLQSLDAWGNDEMSGYDRQQREEEEAPSAPTFDILPVAMTVIEGSPARFLVKAGGYPRPKVQWYINGELLASFGGGGNWRVFQDGGISYLEFHRVGNPAHLQLRAVAKNQYGEAAADTLLVIEPQNDFRPDLRHVAPENPFKKLTQLRKVDCTAELSSALRKPRIQALDLRRVERASEIKARTAAEAETVEAENLYTRVQKQLRTNRRSSLPPPTPAAAQQQYYQPPPPQQQQQTRQPPPQHQQQQPRPPPPPPTQQQHRPPPPQQQPRPPPPPQPQVVQMPAVAQPSKN